VIMARAVRQAFVVRDPTPIPPLEAPGGDAWLLDRTVRDHARTLFERSGLAVHEVATIADAEAAARAATGGSIVVIDSVAFSAQVLRDLLAAYARSAAPALIAALPSVVSTRLLSHVDGLTAVRVDQQDAFTAPLWAISPGATTAAATPALLPCNEKVVDLPLPIGMLGLATVPLGVTESWMCRIDHWLHIQRVSMLALITTWSELGKSAGGKLWYLWRALLGFPWSRGRLQTSIRRVHRTAKIHHSAVVELSVVEEGAEIGAGAIVRNSWIGKGARIDDGACVNACVVGAGAMISNLTAISAAILYPRSFAAQTKMQMCILGEGAVAFTGSFFYDINFSANVRVSHRGRIVDSGERIASVCVGPWARVAGGLWVASGREIPAGALIIQDPARVLTRLDDPVIREQLVACVGNGVVPLGPLPPNRPAGPPQLPAPATPSRDAAAEAAVGTASRPAPDTAPTPQD